MRRVAWIGLAAFVIGALGVVLAAVIDPVRAAYGWLVALSFGYTLGASALLLLMIGYASDAVWLVVIRRPVEAIAGALPILALLFVPILIAIDEVYVWAPGGLPMPQEVAEHVAPKRAWLNEPFFIARSLVYLALPVLLAEPLLAWSRARRRRRPIRARAARVLSAIGIPVLGLTVTFAGFDWIMSLDPVFYSTSFGLLPMASGFLALLGLLAATVAALMRRGALPEASSEHTHAVGKLMLAGVAVWAYLSFTHYLLIWIANLPAELRFYLSRARGGWQALSIVLMVGLFAIPFALLLSRALKRRPSLLGALGAYLAAMHAVHLFWLIVPALRPSGPDLSLADPASLLAVGGAIALVGALRAGALPLVATSDPLLERSLRYRSE